MTPAPNQARHFTSVARPLDAVPRLVPFVLVVALAALLAWPAAATLIEASRGEPGEARGTLLDTALTADIGRPLGLALETARILVATELLALPPGIVLGFLLLRTDLWGRRSLLGLCLLALFVPMPLHALAWLGAIGNVGRSQALGSAPLQTRC
jgi:iron(III) transport system permease protein